jgi:hypothetical protein
LEKWVYTEHVLQIIAKSRSTQAATQRNFGIQLRSTATMSFSEKNQQYSEQKPDFIPISFSLMIIQSAVIEIAKYFSTSQRRILQLINFRRWI